MPDRCMLRKGEELDFFASVTKYKKKIREKSRKTRLGMKIKHDHAFYELVCNMYCNDEKREYRIYDKLYHVEKNCIVGAPPYEEHFSEIGDNVKRFIINFSYKYGKEIFDFLGVDIEEFFKDSVWQYSEEQLDKMWVIVEEIAKECKNLNENEKINKNYRLKVLFLNFASVFVQPQGVGTPVKEGYNVIDDVIGYIKVNYQKPITLDMISNKFYINKYVLCRQFKERTGSGLIEFVNRIRLNHSRELLEETNMSVIDIAEKVGYNSAKYFSSEFKKNVGVAPMVYRNIVKKGSDKTLLEE